MVSACHFTTAKMYDIHMSVLGVNTWLTRSFAGLGMTLDSSFHAIVILEVTGSRGWKHMRCLSMFMLIGKQLMDGRNRY